MMWPMLRPHFNFIANLSGDSNLCPICGGLSLAKPVKMYFYKMRSTIRDKQSIQLSRWGVRWIFFFLYFEHYYSFLWSTFQSSKLIVLVVILRSSTYKIKRVFMFIKDWQHFFNFLHVIPVVIHSCIFWKHDIIYNIQRKGNFKPFSNQIILPYKSMHGK